MKELKDTVDLMLSADYKERFQAEYYQLRNRYDKLEQMVSDWYWGHLDFEPTCPMSTYEAQLRAMRDYLTVLEARAIMEGVNIGVNAEQFNND
jgi:hypothetical protein